MRSKLETTLHTGYANFKICGIPSINEETFPTEDTVSNSGWKYRRASFPVKIGDSNSIYVQMMGGRASDHPVVYSRNKDGQTMEVEWSMRTNEEVLKNIDPFQFIRISLEKDANGKLIEKRFLSEVDAIEYLAEHMSNHKVVITGQVEYSYYNGSVQRSLNITGIFLAKDDEEPVCQLRQTYLLDSQSLPKKWESVLEEDKKLTINAFVPQYISKYDGKKIKRTMALPQQIVVRPKKNDDDRAKKAIQKLFVVDKKVVREIHLLNKMVYGYEKTTGNVKITPELQDLIDLRLMTEEQIQSEATISGQKIDETILVRPIVRGDKKTDGGTLPYMTDRYAPEALVVLDDEEETDSVFTEDEDDNVTQDPFSDDDLFS